MLFYLSPFSKNELKGRTGKTKREQVREENSLEQKLVCLILHYHKFESLSWEKIFSYFPQTHTHTHTHTYIYILFCSYVCMSVYLICTYVSILVRSYSICSNNFQVKFGTKGCPSDDCVFYMELRETN